AFSVGGTERQCNQAAVRRADHGVEAADARVIERNGKRGRLIVGGDAARLCPAREVINGEHTKLSRVDRASVANDFFPPTRRRIRWGRRHVPRGGNSTKYRDHRRSVTSD